MESFLDEIERFLQLNPQNFILQDEVRTERHEDLALVVVENPAEGRYRWEQEAMKRGRVGTAKSA